jgi:hypothetical protein
MNGSWYQKQMAGLIVGFVCSLLPGAAFSFELLADPGFEDPRPLGTDPWRRVFFTLSPMATDARVMPRTGLEHALITKSTAIPGADPQIASSAFAGFGAASGISDFRGAELDVVSYHKVVENTLLDANNEPGVFVRTFLAYFGPSGFLGFGSFAQADVFEGGTNADYVRHAFRDTVPNFSQPVTSIDYNLSVLAPFGSTGSATVFFDDASLNFIPEPCALALLSMGVGFVAACRFRRSKLSR